MHYVAFGGSAFAMFSALYYWFPKLTGRMLSEGLGKVSFWLTLIGFHTTFLVQHSAGLSGMPRRIFEYQSSAGWHAYNLISTIGAFIIALGVLVTSRVRQLVADYVTLTKPKVQSLLLLTTVTTMYVAGDPSLALVFWTVLGGSLASGGAGAVNHWYDRDIDAQMARTATRPVPAGRIAPQAALAFGIVLAGLSFV